MVLGGLERDAHDGGVARDADGGRRRGGRAVANALGYMGDGLVAGEFVVWTGGGAGVRMEGGRWEMGDEVIVEESYLARMEGLELCREYRIAVAE